MATIGGRDEGFFGRSHRRNSAGTSPNQIRQEQQPKPIEPPRWFTARRKLVNLRAHLKLVWRDALRLLELLLPARDTAELRQEFIAPTFLESFGWISLLEHPHSTVPFPKDQENSPRSRRHREEIVGQDSQSGPLEEDLARPVTDWGHLCSSSGRTQRGNGGGCMADLCDVYTRARLLIRLSDNKPTPHHDHSTAPRYLKVKLLFAWSIRTRYLHYHVEQVHRNVTFPANGSGDGISEISSTGIGADHVETSMFLSASLTLALPSPSPLASSNYEESSDPER
ncbi:hypothetical protein HZH68_012250 [Vespula germanica]|uniref:Uncharacterized protein n=1 Tax=Vespula germanica TaxID=30212 RepID=A0A834MZ50_VESGE|nr:hypothetical protein HZH68_012250 [Vespula germanica]